MSAVEIREQLPFKKAIEFFAGKIRLPSSGWTDIWHEQHSHAFVIAGVTHDAILEKIFNELKKAQAEGLTYSDFRKRFDEIKAEHKEWSFKSSPGWRSRVIYQTNMSTSYWAGRWKQIQELKEFRPYLQYRHHTIENPRPLHQSWDGIILPVDDPFWDTHFVPNGWGCKCTIDSLSRWEAKEEWKSKGKDGPDTAPPIEYETRVVGKRSAHPRTVQVPKGIDPGFAYNPGKAWLDPHTPSFAGYEPVFRAQGTPVAYQKPDLPTPTRIPDISKYLFEYRKPEEAVTRFLDVFDANREGGNVYFDKTGTALAISDALFKDGKGELKWTNEPEKAERLKHINLMAATLIEPDEIWWHWEEDRSDKGNWRLRRRYLRSFETNRQNEYAIASFEWSRDGWTGSTVFAASASRENQRLKYFNAQRIGRLLYKK